MDENNQIEKIEKLKENNKSNFIEDQLVILTKPMLDKFLKEKNPADLISLYTFYYYTAKWQKTNQPYCTDGYVQKGLHWGYEKFIKAKKQLLKLGLIEQVINKKADGKIEGYYIKMNYIIKQENNPVLLKASTGKQSINSLSTNNINSLSTNKLSKDNKEDKSSLIDLNSDFSPIKDEIIKYFDLYKKLHPMAKENKYFIKKKINKINTLCKYILNGFPKDNYNLIRTFIKDKNIPYNPNIGFNGDLNKFKELLNIALLSLDTNYFPSNKANITNDFSEFLINDFTEFSYFFEYAFNPPALLQNKIQKSKDIPVKKIKNKNVLHIKKELDICFQSYSINPSILNNFANDVYKEWQDIVYKEFVYDNKKYIRCDIEDKAQFKSSVCDFDNFIGILCHFIDKIGENNKNYDFKFIGVRKKDNNFTRFWEDFILYLDKQEIYLYLDEIEDFSDIERKVTKYLERNK